MLNRSGSPIFIFDKKRKTEKTSTIYVDLSKDSLKNIGVFANWFSAVSQSDEERLGRYHRRTVVMDAPNFPFSIPCSTLQKYLPKWQDSLS